MTAEKLQSIATFAERLLDVAKGARPPWRFGDEPFWATAIIASAARRIFSRHWAELQAAGWTVEDVFGGDQRRPWARVDRQGLALVLRDRRIVEIGRDYVVIECDATRSRSRFSRPGNAR